MKNHAATIIALFTAFIFSSCETDVDIEWNKRHPDHYVEIMQTNKSRTMSFTFSTSEEWIASSNVSWCKIVDVNQQKNKVTIRVRVDENASNGARSAFITIKSIYTQETIVDISIFQSNDTIEEKNNSNEEVNDSTEEANGLTGKIRNSNEEVKV